METVSVYAEVENQVEINGDLPLVAGFDLPAPITEKRFELMRQTIEQQFQDRNTVQRNEGLHRQQPSIPGRFSLSVSGVR
jgi:hypothetical protein